MSKDRYLIVVIDTKPEGDAYAKDVLLPGRMRIVRIRAANIFERIFEYIVTLIKGTRSADMQAVDSSDTPGSSIGIQVTPSQYAVLAGLNGIPYTLKTKAINSRITLIEQCVTAGTIEAV